MNNPFNKLKQWYTDKQYQKELAKIDHIVRDQIYIKERRWNYSDHIEYVVYRKYRFSIHVQDSFTFTDLDQAKVKCDILREYRRQEMINDLHSEFSCYDVKY